MQVAKIEEARRSQSGKTLGVKLNGRWFQTKHWELEHMVGETIEITDSSMSEWQGKSIYWLNEYVTAGTDEAPPGVPKAPPVAASAAREHNRGRPDAADNYTENVLLLRFVGQCFSGYPFQTTDEAMVRSRARMLYKLGQDVLSGKITETETGPRPGTKAPHRIGGVHDGGPLASDSQRGNETPPADPEDDFDTDEIPF